MKIYHKLLSQSNSLRLPIKEFICPDELCFKDSQGSPEIDIIMAYSKRTQNDPECHTSNTRWLLHCQVGVKQLLVVLLSRLEKSRCRQYRKMREVYHFDSSSSYKVTRSFSMRSFWKSIWYAPVRVHAPPLSPQMYNLLNTLWKFRVQWRYAPSPYQREIGRWSSYVGCENYAETSARVGEFNSDQFAQQPDVAPQCHLSGK